jgi:hypothetical protein
MPQSRLAIITFMENGGPSPDQGLPGGGYPSHGLPGGPNYPSAGPVPPGSITLPVFPFDPTRPDNSLPGSQPGSDNTLPGSGGRPSNELPSPGRKYVVKWLACVGLILVPDNELPATAEPK